MKKQLLITFGILLILFVVGIWVFLFMFGTPKDSGDVFARFGLGGNTNNETVPVSPRETKVDVSDRSEGAPQNLKQITTRPVAGAVFAGTGIFYVEEGTGHLYYINLSTGAETLVRGTTIPRAHTATFSKDATFVAITTIENGAEKTFVAPIDLKESGGGLRGVTLPLGASQVSFSGASNTLMYILKETGGASGYSYEPLSGKGGQVFTIPLRDVEILWGETIYGYTTPTALQEGHLYKINASNLAYVTGGGFGLSSFRYASGTIVTKNDDGIITSYAQNALGVQTNLPLAFIPEKCIGARNTLFIYCGVPSEFSNPESFPDNWYKGTVSFSDNLWKVDVARREATALSNFLTESGREIDIRQMGINDTETMLYFVNKNDNTLWVFDMTL